MEEAQAAEVSGALLGFAVQTGGGAMGTATGDSANPKARASEKMRRQGRGRKRRRDKEVDVKRWE